MPHTEGAESRRREASPHRGSETPIQGCPAPRPPSDTGTPASLQRPNLVSASALRSPTFSVRIPTALRHPRLGHRPPPPGPHRQSRQKPMPEAPGRSRRPEPPESSENGNIRVARILPGLRRRSCRGRKRTESSTPPERWAAVLPERQVPASPERRAPAPPGTWNPCRQCHRRHPHRQHCQGTRKPPTPHGNIPSHRALIKFAKYFGNGFSENFQYVTENRKEQDKGSSQAPFSDRNLPFR